MKDTFKQAFSRPYQIAASFGLAVCLYQLQPVSPTLGDWAWWLSAWCSFWTYGVDSYSHGFDRGLAFMNRLEN